MQAEMASVTVSFSVSISVFMISEQIGITGSPVLKVSRSVHDDLLRGKFTTSQDNGADLLREFTITELPNILGIPVYMMS